MSDFLGELDKTLDVKLTAGKNTVVSKSVRLWDLWIDRKKAADR